MSATNLLGIIDDILDFSKIETGKLDIADNGKNPPSVGMCPTKGVHININGLLSIEYFSPQMLIHKNLKICNCNHL